MKKHYAILLTGLLPLSMLGQSNDIQCRDEAPGTVRSKVINNAADYKSGGGAYWEEDFANGFPAGWATENPGGLCPWKWSMNGSHGYWNGNNATTYDDPISSTTAANGFLIADNDSANHFNFGQPSGSTYQYIDTYFITSAIDLSAHPSVKLEFEQYFRLNNSVALEVMVSNDSLNWTTWTVQGNASNNVASDDPETVGINISSVAGGQSSVYLKIGWSARVYFWMIDDIRIVEAPDNDVRLDAAHYNEWFWPNDFSTLEYTIFPMNQIRPLMLKTNFTNNGTAPQTGVTMEVNVFDDSNTNILNATESMLTALAPGANDSLSISTNVITGLGRNTISYEMSADSVDFNPDDNTGHRWVEISDYTFARDTGALDGNVDNQGEAYQVGNWFNMVNDDFLYGIDVAIDDATVVGTTITGVIYDGNRDPIEWTEDHDVTTADLNAAGDANFVTLLFSTPVDLFSGENYLVMAEHYGGADNVEFGTSGISPAQTSLLWDEVQQDWFYVTRTPMIRMNLDPSVGIQNEGFDPGIRLDQNYPNPVSGNTQITFKVDKAMDVSFEVHDMTGKLVQYMDLGTVARGEHLMNIPADEFSDGIYFYSLTTEDHTLTKRMVVLNK